MEAAAVFEVKMSPDKSRKLASFMEEHGTTRPAEVELATQHMDGEDMRLVAYWSSREALGEYWANSSIMRGTALMRQLGAESTASIVDVGASVRKVS